MACGRLNIRGRLEGGKPPTNRSLLRREKAQSIKSLFNWKDRMKRKYPRTRFYQHSKARAYLAKSIVPFLAPSSSFRNIPVIKKLASLTVNALKHINLVEENKSIMQTSEIKITIDTHTFNKIKSLANDGTLDLRYTIEEFLKKEKFNNRKELKNYLRSRGYSWNKANAIISRFYQSASLEPLTE